MELTWRKSSYSVGDEDTDCVEVAWHKNNSSGTGSNDTIGAAADSPPGSRSIAASHDTCVQATRLPPPLPPAQPSAPLLSAVRDSKNPAAILTFPTTLWRTFLDSLSGSGQRR